MLHVHHGAPFVQGQVLSTTTIFPHGAGSSSAREQLAQLLDQAMLEGAMVLRLTQRIFSMVVVRSWPKECCIVFLTSWGGKRRMFVLNKNGWLNDVILITSWLFFHCLCCTGAPPEEPPTKRRRVGETSDSGKWVVCSIGGLANFAPKVEILLWSCLIVACFTWWYVHIYIYMWLYYDFIDITFYIVVIVILVILSIMCFSTVAASNWVLSIDRCSVETIEQLAQVPGQMDLSSLHGGFILFFVSSITICVCDGCMQLYLHPTCVHHSSCLFSNYRF